MGKRLKVGDPAPAVEVKNLDEQELSVEELWSQGPTLLTFLRHFG